MRKICHYSFVITLIFAYTPVIASSNLAESEQPQKVNHCVYINTHVSRDECYDTLKQLIKNNKLLEAKEYYFKQIEIYDQKIQENILTNKIELKRISQFNKLKLQNLFHFHAENILICNTNKYDKDITFIDICLGKSHYYVGQPESKYYFDKAKNYYNDLMEKYTNNLKSWEKMGFNVSSCGFYLFDQNKKAHMEEKFGPIFGQTIEQNSPEETLKASPQLVTKIALQSTGKQNPKAFLENLRRPQASIIKSPKRKHFPYPLEVRQKLSIPHN